jgi:phosphohistidine phosphatase SixA
MDNFKPKYLILARHGTYDETTGNLDENGVMLVERVALKLKEKYLDGLKIGLLYSPILRTRQTAEIYARILNVPFNELQADDTLRGTKDDPNKLEEIKIEEATKTLEKVVLSRIAEAYVAITHEDTAIDLTLLFLKRNYGLEESINTMGFACAFLINLENPKEFVRLRP